jgi:hypothetical protein
MKILKIIYCSGGQDKTEIKMKKLVITKYTIDCMRKELKKKKKYCNFKKKKKNTKSRMQRIWLIFIVISTY